MMFEIIQTLNESHVNSLEQLWSQDPNPSMAVYQHIASSLELSCFQIRMWFKKRNNRHRRKIRLEKRARPLIVSTPLPTDRPSLASSSTLGFDASPGSRSSVSPLSDTEEGSSIQTPHPHRRRPLHNHGISEGTRATSRLTPNSPLNRSEPPSNTLRHRLRSTESSASDPSASSSTMNLDRHPTSSQTRAFSDPLHGSNAMRPRSLSPNDARQTWGHPPHRPTLATLLNPPESSHDLASTWSPCQRGAGSETSQGLSTDPRGEFTEDLAPSVADPENAQSLTKGALELHVMAIESAQNPGLWPRHGIPLYPPLLPRPDRSRMTHKDRLPGIAEMLNFGN